MYLKILFLSFFLVILLAKKVKLVNVDVLTFNHDETTATRRNYPKSKLNCIGGSSRCKSSALPKSVQCYNRGHDGVDVNWQCKAMLSSAFKLGKTVVVCEGYDYPEDPYILNNSCYLEYEIDNNHDSGRSVKEQSTDSTHFLVIIGGIGVALLIYWTFLRPATVATNQPPTYAQATKSQQSYGWNTDHDENSQGSPFSTGNLFTHAAAGAAGFMAGRATAGTETNCRERSTWRDRSSSNESDKYCSESFATTQRR